MNCVSFQLMNLKLLACFIFLTVRGVVVLTVTPISVANHQVFFKVTMQIMFLLSLSFSLDNDGTNVCSINI